MKYFDLDSKIAWRRDSSVDISQAFYPSFYKDLVKRESFFNETFRFEIIAADTKKLNSSFAPLYLSEVANRHDFTLDKNKIISQLSDKITKNNFYKFLFVYHENEIVTAILFSLKKEGLYLAYKANKKDFDKTLRHKGTVSYWTEKLIFDYGKSLGVKFFSYGTDSNPYFGKTRIGLSLYKIKTGMRPKKPEPDIVFSSGILDEQSIKDRNEPVIFFTNPDAHNYYQDCFLYSPFNSLDESYIREFEKVFRWSRIKLNLISY